MQTPMGTGLQSVSVGFGNRILIEADTLWDVCSIPTVPMCISQLVLYQEYSPKLLRYNNRHLFLPLRSHSDRLGLRWLGLALVAVCVMCLSFSGFPSAREEDRRQVRTHTPLKASAQNGSVFLPPKSHWSEPKAGS